MRKDEERDTSREVTGGLEDCRLGAEVNPLLTSHLLFLACLRMTPIPPLRNYANQGRIPVELFQILKDDAVKVLHSICQQVWKTQQWPQD